MKFSRFYLLLLIIGNHIKIKKHLILIGFFGIFYLSSAQSMNDSISIIFQKWQNKLELNNKPNDFDIKKIITQKTSSKDSLKSITEYYRKNRFKLKRKNQIYLNLLRQKLALKLKDTIQQILVLHDMSGILNNFSAFDDAYQLSSYSLELSKQARNDTLQLYAINFMSGSLGRQMKNDDAIKVIDSAESKLSGIKHKVWTALFANKGIAYEQKGDYKNAIKYYLKSYEVANNYKDKRAQIIALYNLGYLYNQLKQYDKSLKYLKESLELSKKSKNKDYKAYSYEQLGLTYGGIDSLKTSLQYYKKALKLFKELGNKPFEALTNKNIAATLINLNQPEKALDFAKKATYLAKGLQPSFILLGSQQTLALALIDNKKFDEAEKLIKENIDLQDQMDLSTLIDLYEGLYQISLQKKNYKSALEYYKKSDALLDSLAYNKKMEMVRNIETKYQTEKKERKIAQQQNIIKAKELETQKARTRNLLLIIGLLSALLIAFFIWRRYRAEAKAKRIISGQKAVIEELQKELHHRIKNNLNIIDAFVDEIIDDYEDDHKLKRKLEELQNRIYSIKEVHTQLYQNADINNVAVKKYIDELANKIAATYKNKNVSIKQQIKDDLTLKGDKSFVVGLIVNEFLTNSYKYAFDKDGEIQVELSETDDNYVLKLSDNGKGLPKNFNIKSIGSYGLRIMLLLSKQLKGTFDLRSHNGVQLTIQFPKV